MFSKRNLGKWCLAIAMLLVVSAMVTDHFVFPTNEKQIATAQSQLNKLEGELKKSISVIADFQTPAQFHGFFVRQARENQGFNFFCFSNDSLLYWSDNKISLSFAEVNGIKDEDVLQLPNGVYESFVEQKGNKKVIGLLLLRKQYAYENKYLVNSFNPNLKLRENAVIVSADSATTSGRGTPLYSVSGKELISIAFTQELSADGSLTIQAGLYLSAWFFLLAGFLFVRGFRFEPSLNYSILISVFLAALRLYMISMQWPGDLYNTDFFSPKAYASSILFNSVGDLLLNAATLFSMAATFSFYFNSTVQKQLKARHSRGYAFVSVIVLLALAFFIHKLIAGLIINSKINFENPIDRGFDLNIVAALLSIMLILWGYLWMSISAIRIFSESRRYSVFSLRLNLLALLFFSCYTTFSIIHYSKIKEKESQKLFASRLDSRQDHLAEYLFDDIEKRISRDSVIKSLFKENKKANEEINKRLQQVYFKGYWSKFDVMAVCFDGNSHPLDPTLSQSLQGFQAVIKERGKETFCDNLYFLPDETGQLQYMALLPVTLSNDSAANATIVLSLSSRLIQSHSAGFPELFVSSRVTESNAAEMEYSFARYNNNSLVYAYGSYPYAFTPVNFSKPLAGFTGSVPETGKELFFEMDNFNHLLFKPAPSTLIVVSRPSELFFNTLSLLCYVLLFFSFFFFLIAGTVFRFKDRVRTVFTLKQRIRFSIVALVILSFLLTVTGTIAYVMKKYDKDQDRNILSRLNTLWFVLYDNIRFQSDLSTLKIDDWSAKLSQLSDNLNMDFNLYDETGKLFYSSEGKIFDQGIVSARMNPEAVFEITQNDRTQFVHPENVGQLNYIAAYAPVTGFTGKIIGYLNLPYFEKQNELKKEISGFISALINIYVLLLVIAIFLALFISSRITRPLLLIQEKLKRSSGFLHTATNRDHAMIEWASRDEIGELVREYNKMVEEIGKSAEKLARSERESAWREMAQQVAHEIKNPLTPMKLSVQHLQLAWNEKRENLDELFNRISKTLIEQIDVLSNIATEFSSFAKMPKAKSETVELHEAIRSSINLFDFSAEGVKIEYKDDNVQRTIHVDKEQVIRVFSNLIKNAIQSIEETEQGIIRIGIHTEQNHHVIQIEDNGKGIPAELQSRIFTPHFTTKTSGMGLGLAIVKSIIETMDGEIWFESEEGKGTKIFVKLPSV